MKLLFVVEDANLKGGTKIQTFNLLSALRDAGKDVYVLSLVPYVGNNPYVLSLGDKEYAQWRSKSLSLTNKLSFSIPSDRILRRVLKDIVNKYQPDLLVCQIYDLISALPFDYHVAQVFNWSVVGYEASLKNIINRKALVVVYFLLSEALKS